MIQKMMPLLLRIIVILQGNWTFESSYYFSYYRKKIRSMHIVSAITYIYFGISYAI